MALRRTDPDLFGELLYEDKPSNFIEKVQKSLRFLNTTDFGPDGINEAGFKALVVGILAHYLDHPNKGQGKTRSILSEQLVRKKDTDRDGFADLVLREGHDFVFLELKYLKVGFMFDLYPLGTSSSQNPRVGWDGRYELRTRLSLYRQIADGNRMELLNRRFIFPKNDEILANINSAAKATELKTRDLYENLGSTSLLVRPSVWMRTAIAQVLNYDFRKSGFDDEIYKQGFPLSEIAASRTLKKVVLMGIVDSCFAWTERSESSKPKASQQSEDVFLEKFGQDEPRDKFQISRKHRA